MDIMNGDQIELTKIVGSIDKIVSDPIWNPIVKKTAVDCLAKTSANIDELKKLLPPLPKSVRIEDCNINVMAFVECHFNEADAACPLKYSKDTKECKDARESLVKCNNNVENIVPLFLGHLPK